MNSNYIHLTPRPTQRGISLIMVLLVMVLITLTALSASRSSLFNESVTGNEADYNRALAAAESLVRDAQLDIAGMSADAVDCNYGVGFEGCRPNATGKATATQPFFPDTISKNATGPIQELQTALNNTCFRGICAPNPWPANGLPANFWLVPATLQSFVNGPNNSAATYGQFTGAAPAATGNPILTANPARAWYWVELIEFQDAACAALPTQCIKKPIPAMPFVYRITAVAQGMRANTLAVIQTFYVPYPVP